MKSLTCIQRWGCPLALPLVILSATCANAQSEPPAKVLTVPSLKSVPTEEVAAPVLLKQLGITPGSIHKIGVGLGVTKFRTIKIGLGGWVSFECLEANSAGWNRGEKYWVNLKTVTFISAPFVSSSESEGKPASKRTPVKR